MIDYSKVKIVIWDLDETFWEGNPSGNCAMTVLDCTDGVLSVECEGKDIVSEVDLKKNHIFMNSCRGRIRKGTAGILFSDVPFPIILIKHTYSKMY